MSAGLLLSLVLFMVGSHIASSEKALDEARYKATDAYGNQWENLRRGGGAAIGDVRFIKPDGFSLTLSGDYSYEQTK